MLRVVPIVLAIAVCFLNLAFISLDSHKNYSEPADAYTLHNHLTQDKNAQAAPINTVQIFEDVTENPVEDNAAAFVPRMENILRLYWNIIPNAVKYEILIDGATLYAYTNGIEIPVSNLSAKFQVNAISLEGTTLENKIPIREIDTNPTSPRTTTEFDKMAYPPIYPVYSWIPVNGANHYEIELISFAATSPTLIRATTTLICMIKRPCLMRANIFGECGLLPMTISRLPIGRRKTIQTVLKSSTKSDSARWATA